MNLSSFNRWIRGLEEDEPNFSAEWDWRILRSLNKTLGYEPSHAKFIARVEAKRERIHYAKEDLLKKDLNKAKRTVEYATHDWKEEWLKRWSDGPL